MKLYALLFTGLALTLCCSSWNRTKHDGPKKFHITGMVYVTRSYCGGVRPTEEMLEEFRKRQPQPGMTIYFREGNSNSPAQKILDSATTDQNGMYAIDLAAGTYCIVEKWKTQPLVMPQNDKYTTWDTACYRANYHRCDYQLEVKSNQDSANVGYQKRCSWNQPCIKSYSGPKPS